MVGNYGYGTPDLNTLYSVHAPGMTSAAPMAVYRGYGTVNPLQKVKDFMSSPGIRLLALLVMVGFVYFRVLSAPARSVVRRGARRTGRATKRAAKRAYGAAKERDWRGRKLKREVIFH
jgi:hypothetical protein